MRRGFSRSRLVSVTATYYDRVSVRLKPAGEPPVDRTVEAMIAAPPGAPPGATRTTQRVATVTITGWSPADRVVTFLGPNGMAYSRRLLDTTDPAIVAGLKVGDRVDVTRTEAVSVSVQSVTVSAQPAPEDDFLNRLTASVVFGWDNQFAGKMITESTGRTTGGAPINLQETTYDEVYGRIGMFKLGVGYRTTPRAEAVVGSCGPAVLRRRRGSQSARWARTRRRSPSLSTSHRSSIGASRWASGGSSHAPASRPS